MYVALGTIDSEPLAEDLWAEGQNEETEPEESEGVGRRHAGSSAWVKGQRVGGLQSQPEDCEEGGGEGKPV